jgi:1-deoxy-D-xylulose-5-phosphate reductoisomerase
LAGGTLPAVFNAANEVAVDAFIARSIRFPDIWRVVAEAMERHQVAPADSLETVIEADRWARETALAACRGLPV